MIRWFKSPSKNKRNDFISLASHELRSPLSVVKWYVEMLLDGDAGTLTDEQVNYLTVIQSANQRSIDLVRSLLNVSRLDLDTFCIVPQKILLQDILRPMLDIYKVQAQKRNIVINENLTSSREISVDKQIVSLLFRSLLENAVAFSKEEGGTITVTLKDAPQYSKEGGFSLEEASVLFTIEDTGIGIPEEDNEIVFSRFSKAKNSRDSSFTGSGLGLYLVKTITEKIGSHVWFTSQKDIGTTFYIAFPLSGMKPKKGETTLD